MKKFITVIVFVFLIAILISFNYLLWDREKQMESFQNISDSKDITIDTLSEKMNNLNKQNKDLTNRVKSLEQENATIQNDREFINNKNVGLNEQIDSKNSQILLLKQMIDTEPIDAILKKWVDAINTKNYKAAQALISNNSKDTILNDSDKLKETYQKELKAIRFKSSKLFTDLTDETHLQKIQFKVVFDVDKPDRSGDSKETSDIFKSGENEKYITMEYNSETKEWLIVDLTNEP